MTEARLGFAIDSSQAAQAASDLDRLKASSEGAGSAADKVSVAATRASRSFADVAPALEKIASGLDRLNQTSADISNKLDAMARASTGAAKAARTIGDAANDAGKGVDNLSDKIKKGNDSARSFGDQAAHVKAFRDEIDRLAARFAPVQTAADKYQAAIADIQSAHKLGVISAQQMAAELDKERLAYERLSVSANKVSGKTAPAAANQNRGGGGLQTANIAAQFQDIGVTAAMGSSPIQIALQQGTQLTAALGNGGLKQTVSSLGAAFASVFSWQSLVVTGAVAATAAGIQYFMKAKDGALSLDDALKANANTLDLLKDRYGNLAKVSASLTSVAGGSFVLSDARSQQTAINATLRNQIGGFLGSANNSALSVFGTNGQTAVGGLQNLQGDQKQFASAVSDLLERVKSGQPGLEKFNEDVEALYNNLVLTAKDPESLRAAANSIEALGDKAFTVGGKFKPFQDAINILKVRGVDGLSAFADQVHRVGEEKGITKLADELIAKGGDIVKLAQQSETLRRTLQAIDREDTRPGLADRNNLQAYVARRDVQLQRTNEQFGADQQAAAARTFAERLAAVDRQSRAQHPTNADEGGGADARAARAVEAERNRQQIELRDSAHNRSVAMDSAIKDQQEEITLVGKAAGETAGLRKEYELTSQVRLEAAKNGSKADEDEIAKIREKSAELGKLVEAYNRAKLANDLSFQRDQFGRSSTGRSVAERLRSAGLPVDLLSKSAFDVASGDRLAINQNKGIAQDQFDAQLKALQARTDAERVAAARAVADAQNQLEPDDVRKQRVDNAGALAQAQIDKEQADATRERSLNLKRLVEDEQHDIDMIGKTGAAAAAAAEQYQLMAQIRAEAAKRGITDETEIQTVFAKQIEQIKETSAEYGKLIEQRNQAQFTFDTNRNMADARLSARDRQIVQTQRQYGLSENPNDANGQMIGRQLDWQDAKNEAKQFGDAFSSELISGSHNLGKAFLKGFETSLENEAQKLWGKLFDSLGNVFADWLTGSKGTGGSQAGAASGIGAIGSKLLGGAANDNKVSAATGAGSALGFVGNYKSGVDPRLTDILGTAATKFPGFKVNAISGFRAGDPRFHGQGRATDVQLSDLASGKVLGNYQDPATFATYEKFAQTARAVQMDKYPELANQFRWGGYFSGPPGKYGAVDQMHFDLGGNKVGMAGGSWANGLTSAQAAYFPGIQSTGLNDAAKAVDKLATSSVNASKSVGTLGTGLGQLGNSLGGISLSPGSGSAVGQYSGLWGGIGKLLGGISPTSSLWAPNTTLGGFLGLPAHANGTNYAPGGPSIVGEKGPELLNLPQGSQVTSNHKLMSALAANSNQPRQNQSLIVNIQGANGDEHVRTLVQQGVGAALSENNTQMRRGGFGVLQARYANQKG